MSERPKTCGTCGWWVQLTFRSLTGDLGVSNDRGECTAPVPACLIRWDKVATDRNQGQSCKAWKPREEAAPDAR